jgi:hypothetical protein
VMVRSGCGFQLASRSIGRDTTHQRLSFAPVPSFCSSCECNGRCHQSWTLIFTPIHTLTMVALLSLHHRTPERSQYERGSLGEQFLIAGNTGNLMARGRYLESGIMAESDKGPVMVAGIGIGAVDTARIGSYSGSVATPAAQRALKGLLITRPSALRRPRDSEIRSFRQQ